MKKSNRKARSVLFAVGLAWVCGNASIENQAYAFGSRRSQATQPTSRTNPPQKPPSFRSSIPLYGRPAVGSFVRNPFSKTDQMVKVVRKIVDDTEYVGITVDGNFYEVQFFKGRLQVNLNRPGRNQVENWMDI